MIDIKRKEECVGCSACVERCPVQCISFNRDEQGFRYPKVDISRCIGCSLCERVCPVLNQSEAKEPVEVLGAINKDTAVVMSSSSGGIFFALAKRIIEQDGVVFGAKFDSDFNVVHSYTETIEGLSVFQGSKYVQSDIGDSFRQAETFLKQGRRVLFSGTPCQIAALGLFLRKDYGDQLLKVDVICHGVPSPLVWRKYISNLSEKGKITHVSFRDKREGWSRYGFSYKYIENGTQHEYFEPMRNNLYMQAFLRDLTLRPSCFECPAKRGRSGSDITLGDFWHVDSLNADMYYPMGTSLVAANNEFGRSVLLGLEKLTMQPTTYSTALISNGSLIQSAVMPQLYDSFWRSYISSPQLSVIAKFVKKSRGFFLRRAIRLILNKIKV